MVWTIIKVIAFTGLLTMICKQAYNLIFFLNRKPNLWILLMFVIGFLFFMISSEIQDSFNAIWLSAALTFFTLIPPKKDKSLEVEINGVTDDVFSEMGIKKGRLKYRIGLSAYIAGCLLGWIAFYGSFYKM